MNRQDLRIPYPQFTAAPRPLPQRAPRKGFNAVPWLVSLGLFVAVLVTL